MTGQKIFDIQCRYARYPRPLYGHVMTREATREWRRRQRHERNQAKMLARACAAGLADYDKTELDAEYEAVMREDQPPPP